MITTKPTPMHCQKCDHIWQEEMIFNVAISVFVAHMKAIYCPECGAGCKSIGFVTDEAKLRASIKDKAEGKARDNPK